MPTSHEIISYPNPPGTDPTGVVWKGIGRVGIRNISNRTFFPGQCAVVGFNTASPAYDFVPITEAATNTTLERRGVLGVVVGSSVPPSGVGEVAFRGPVDKICATGSPEQGNFLMLNRYGDKKRVDDCSYSSGVIFAIALSSYSSVTGSVKGYLLGWRI